MTGTDSANSRGRFVVRDDGGGDVRRVWAGVEWLAGRGGGTVLAPLLQDLEEYFGVGRDLLERRLSKEGIAIGKFSKHERPSGHLLAIYPDEADIELVEGLGCPGDIMAVEWRRCDLDCWCSRYEVVECLVE